MSQNKLSVERFVRVLETAGIDQAARERLHQVFERDDPEGHAAFLAALNVPTQEIASLRAKFATPNS